MNRKKTPKPSIADVRAILWMVTRPKKRTSRAG